MVAAGPRHQADKCAVPRRVGQLRKASGCLSGAKAQGPVQNSRRLHSPGEVPRSNYVPRTGVLPSQKWHALGSQP